MNAVAALILCLAAGPSPQTPAAPAISWSAIQSPVIFKGDAVTAYRDPAAVYHGGMFHLFFTLVRTESDGKIFMYTAKSTSRDLVRWTSAMIFTPRDQRLNYCSPGDVVRYRDEWILCLSSYPRPNGEKYGNKDARIWMLRSMTWSIGANRNCYGSKVPVYRSRRWAG